MKQHKVPFFEHLNAVVNNTQNDQIAVDLVLESVNRQLRQVDFSHVFNEGETQQQMTFSFLVKNVYTNERTRRLLEKMFEAGGWINVEVTHAGWPDKTWEHLLRGRDHSDHFHHTQVTFQGVFKKG